MHYIIEDNIDFFKEINNIDNNNLDDKKNEIIDNEIIDNEIINNEIIDNDNLCLINYEKLDSNHITLYCNHKFNYVPLYKEILIQKRHKFSSGNYLSSNRNSIKLNSFQIYCPYCRKIQNKLLPYIPLYKDIKLLNSINSPASMCMKHLNCNHIFKTGKNISKKCNKNGFNTIYGDLCYTHYKQYLNKTNKKNKIAKKEISKEDIEWTDEMELYKKKYTVKELQQQLSEHNISKTGIKKILINRIFINKLNK